MFGLKKYSFLLFLLPVFTLFSASSCGEKVGEEISVSLSRSEVSSAKGSQFVSVEAGGDWILTLAYQDGEPGWAEIDETSGTGNNSSIVLKYSENASETSRSLMIILTSGGQDVSCVLVQNGTQSGGGDHGGGSGDEHSGNPENIPAWMELPAVNEDDGLTFVKHDMTIGGIRTRNYSLYWDKENLVAHWVAYPLSNWTIGDGDRTEKWGYDPEIPREQQPRLDKGFKGSSGTGYDRGHQCPSADRLERNANVKTFYFTNMTPQLGKQFNQSIWNSLEGKVRSIAQGADTLYVVTGCLVEGSTKKAYDNDGKAVTVPTAYFKALLRYQKSGSTTGIAGYSGAAYFLEHKSYSQKTVDASMLMSIDELEQKTGIDFFVNLSSKIGNGPAARVEAQKPDGGIWL